MSPPTAPPQVLEIISALAAAGFPEAEVAVAAATVFPQLAAIDLAVCLVDQQSYPTSTRAELSAALGATSHYSNAEIESAADVLFPPPPPAAGDLDLTFGTGGKIITDFDGRPADARDVLVQSDGKLVVAGYTTNSSSTSDLALIRYNMDGSLDPSFGTGGKVTTNFNGNSGFGYSMIQQSDGKLVVASSTTNSSSTYDFALIRYESNGSLDPSFGEGGKVTTNFNGNAGYAYSVTQQSDGKLVVAGYTFTSSSGIYNFALSRYESNGSLDLTFGEGGKVTTGFNGLYDSGCSVTQQRDGKLVVAGYAGYAINSGGNNIDFALSRYESNGSLDLTFGKGGKVTTDFYGNADYAYSMTEQRDGKLVVAGVATNFSIGGDNFALSRYNIDGSLDPSFGTGGKVTTDFAGGDDRAYSVAIQPNGNIILAGTSDGKFALARYLGV